MKALAAHFLHDCAEHDLNDKACNAAPDKLAGHACDIETARCGGARSKKAAKKLAAADCACDEVAYLGALDGFAATDAACGITDELCK